ncbi:hypothetical protein ACG33_10125 [Steroidobacter denitrificans]|uniref:Glycosyltransferase 2-like domain-containing protein n=1 Tax=Steroidobacter denitrificans TaxID=465721 RepID=A0A127FAK0_STEDE|nr:glycosyltransferase family 2 protein [Steroidobacter denitrificans]AMN47447.1 hypothetical protein ACG33_10125 [Steroidobacter denitrificans]
MSTSIPLVSVVTPFYNTDAYLADCIKSVIVQSYGNWEYILVNNKSTDRSADIAREYARTDSRIRVVETPEFLSQVQNYNFALQQISSRSAYCKIVQADDWIFPECISRMVEVGETHPSTGVISAYRLCGTQVRNVGLDCRTDFFMGRRAGRAQLLHGGNYFGSPSSVMFRAEIVRKMQPFYRENIPCEDTAACLDVLKNHDLGFIHQIGSFEREDNPSISARLRLVDPDWLLSRFILILDYGRDFLTEAEFSETFAGIRHDYFRFLARNTWLFRESAFWTYHLEGMRSSGYVFRYRSMIKPLLMEFGNMLGNPKNSIASLLARIRHRAGT